MYHGFCLPGGGGVLRFSVPGGTEKIAGLWFIRDVSVPRLRCTTRKGGGGGVGGFPCFFLKIKKSAQIFLKKTLIVSILGFNLPFKM